MTFSETPPPSRETLESTDKRRRRQLIILAFGAAAVLMIFISVLGATGGSGSTDEAVAEAAADEDAATGGSGVVLEDAPDIEFELVESREFTTLAAFEGTPLVLNFYASWCAPCVAELPEFQSVSESVAGEVAFLGLNVTDTAENAARITADAGVTYELGLDPTGEIVSTFNQLGTMPTTVLITADGKIAHVSPSRILEEDLCDLITEHFGVEAC